jgi:hypothetical protein
MPAKLDLYKKHASDYAAPRTPKLVTIPPARYLSIDGKGEPGGTAFQNRLGALYNMAFTIKMARKFAGRDYAVCKLEGLWWVGEKDPKHWNWKLMIRTPDFIGEAECRDTADQLLAKGKDAAVRDVVLETLEEGLSVQVLHLGPYTEEAGTIASMKAFAREKGFELHGAITRSTSRIRGASRPSGCARSCATRYGGGRSSRLACS